MLRKVAYLPMNEDQVVDDIPMEPRIARIESDVSHMKRDIENIQLDLRELRGDMKSTNESISGLKSEVAGFRAALQAVDAKIDARVNALEVRLIKWIIGTVLASAGVTFTIAKLVS